MEAFQGIADLRGTLAGPVVRFIVLFCKGFGIPVFFVREDRVRFSTGGQQEEQIRFPPCRNPDHKFLSARQCSLRVPVVPLRIPRKVDLTVCPDFVLCIIRCVRIFFGSFRLFVFFQRSGFLLCRGVLVLCRDIRDCFRGRFLCRSFSRLRRRFRRSFRCGSRRCFRDGFLGCALRRFRRCCLSFRGHFRRCRPGCFPGFLRGLSDDNLFRLVRAQGFHEFRKLDIFLFKSRLAVGNRTERHAAQHHADCAGKADYLPEAFLHVHSSVPSGILKPGIFFNV